MSRHFWSFLHKKLSKWECEKLIFVLFFSMKKIVD
jgi:hypothetical protein